MYAGSRWKRLAWDRAARPGVLPAEVRTRRGVTGRNVLRLLALDDIMPMDPQPLPLSCCLMWPVGSVPPSGSPSR
ncbi:hypothetical protein [Streptomyces sp. FZ201]|uniref:hypothetical protein n=1 Tax=Streptomyces sp. FZ201 TaxID=3057122 RepID=UPI0021C00422|nr:hypothetical protein [Streptomyces sp. FZ201]